MKNFEIPVLVEIEDMAEGVYAASGATEPVLPPQEEAPCNPDWKVYWDHHNGGQKSFIRMKGCQHQKAGNSISIYLELVSSACISGQVHTGDVDVEYLDAKTIKLTRRGHFNAGDNIDFNVGAFSFTGSPFNTEETGSYYDTATAPSHEHEIMGDASGPFVIKSIGYSHY